MFSFVKWEQGREIRSTKDRDSRMDLPLAYMTGVLVSLGREGCCWVLTASLEEGVRRYSINSTDTGSQAKGKTATARTLYTLPVPRHSDPLASCGHPSLARHDQDL